MDQRTTAQTNRSLRTIRAELEYLTDASLITPAQLTSFLSQLPSVIPLHAPVQSDTPASTIHSITPISTPVSIPQPPTAQFGNTSISEKQSSFYAPTSPAPPVYSPPQASSIATATALYAYTPSDAGDLSLAAGDRIAITEYMNTDWAKGRNERTAQEGIFPRSYVNVVENNKNGPVSTALPPTQPAGSSYGNLPLEVSQSGGGGGGSQPSKLNENGKKFGKKLGNAAIFGAGASIGSNIVNGIF